jgi:hypothetical protein
VLAFDDDEPVVALRQSRIMTRQEANPLASDSLNGRP